MALDKETSKLVSVAKLYYEENLTQSQIAKKMGISRPLVSNLLGKAREQGIVEIKIKEPFSNNNLLLNQLKNIYNIQGGYVIPSSNSPYLEQKSIINQSISFFKELLNEGNTIGLGWGTTIGQFVEELSRTPYDLKHEGNITPLIGTASFPDKGYHPSELIRKVGEFTGLAPSYFYAPAFPTSEQEKELYTQTDNYKDLENHWDNLDTVIISIGGYPSVPDHATALRFGNKLNDKKAVGKILSYFFNKDGEFINGEEDYALQIPKKYLVKVKKVVAICPAETSPKAILGALKLGFITHVVLTESKAKTVISLRAQ